MKNRKVPNCVGVLLIFMLALSSCNLPMNGSSADVQEQVAQTLAAIGSQTALAALPTANPAVETAIPTPMTPPENTPVPINHTIMPGEMQAIESTLDDLLYNGDDFSSNLYERPLTSVEMQNRYDLDIQKVSMSTDNTFFYFSIDLRDVNVGTKTIDGNYGVELDLDKDGRGDYLLWAYMPPTSTTWVSDGIALFSDVNNDVGSSRALLSDPIAQTDGYETEVWPGKPMTDPDGAWMRISPASPTTVQLAVKRSLLGNPTLFLWAAWSDDQIKAPYKFDYNDFYTAAEAGSPFAADPNYPLKGIAQIDNTCREAWAFTPTGNEPGICKKITATPKPTTKPNSTAKPTNTKTVLTPSLTATKPTLTPTKYSATDTPTCTDVQISAQVTPWDVSYTSGVTLCINGDCKNPDSGGYAVWYLPAGGYTITASSPYGISPQSATVKLGCGEKSLTQFVIGPG